MIDPRLAAILLAWYAAMSAATYLALWRDKRAARLGRWRTPESSLHLIELLGGWPGAMLGQRLLRHKSRKLSYRLTLFLIAALHVGGWVVVVWWLR